MAFQPLYTAVASAHGGRTGHVESDDGLIAMTLAMPTALGGPGGNGTNPEQLFAAGYSACFESALLLVARTQKVAVQDVVITAQVTIGKPDGGGFGLSVELHGKLPGLEKSAAQALMEAAHQVCPYSRATRGNIPVKLVVD
jgi:osmotically inducible protein OsmC